MEGAGGTQGGEEWQPRGSPAAMGPSHAGQDHPASQHLGIYAQTTHAWHQGAPEWTVHCNHGGNCVSKAVFYISTQLNLMTVNERVDKANPEGKAPVVWVPSCL